MCNELFCGFCKNGKIIFKRPLTQIFTLPPLPRNFFGAPLYTNC